MSINDTVSWINFDSSAHTFVKLPATADGTVKRVDPASAALPLVLSVKRSILKKTASRPYDILVITTEIEQPRLTGDVANTQRTTLTERIPLVGTIVTATMDLQRTGHYVMLGQYLHAAAFAGADMAANKYAVTVSGDHLAGVL